MRTKAEIRTVAYRIVAIAETRTGTVSSAQLCFAAWILGVVSKSGSDQTFTRFADRCLQDAEAAAGE